ncbi:hypothetical protein BT69DRAFT_1304368 [Atractiella rhizophila]|nr:hypothetical protein BT69DRAFT_1304368 [Atractiella rhizophila]
MRRLFSKLKKSKVKKGEVANAAQGCELLTEGSNTFSKWVRTVQIRGRKFEELGLGGMPLADQCSPIERDKRESQWLSKILPILAHLPGLSQWEYFGVQDILRAATQLRLLLLVDCTFLDILEFDQQRIVAFEGHMLTLNGEGFSCLLPYLLPPVRTSHISVRFRIRRELETVANFWTKWKEKITDLSIMMDHMPGPTFRNTFEFYLDLVPLKRLDSLCLDSVDIAEEGFHWLIKVLNTVTSQLKELTISVTFVDPNALELWQKNWSFPHLTEVIDERFKDIRIVRILSQESFLRSWSFRQLLYKSFLYWHEQGILRVGEIPVSVATKHL